MVDIYRVVYNNHHYLIGIGLSTLASVYVARKQYPRAEQLYTEALQVFGETLPADHLNTAIAQIKLGRTLVREQRYQEAEGHILSGYSVLVKQSNPSVSYLGNAREDLATVYEALGEPEKAKKFRGEAAQ
jgi:eukaryotic-like serine/threonine-protein kinase